MEMIAMYLVPKNLFLRKKETLNTIIENKNGYSTFTLYYIINVWICGVYLSLAVVLIITIIPFCGPFQSMF